MPDPTDSPSPRPASPATRAAPYLPAIDLHEHVAGYSARAERPARPSVCLPGPDRAGVARGDLWELGQALSDLATRTNDIHDVADGLGITVQVADQTVFGGSNGFTQAVDEIQYSVMEGPCLQAHASGVIVRSERIAVGEPRWPRFVPRAAAAGLRSVVSAPLGTPGRAAGSLNLYATSASRLDVLEPATVLEVAEQILHELTAAVREGVAGANARWFTDEVRERADIDRAVAALVARYRISGAEASVLITQLAVEDGTTEADAARSVLDEPGDA